MGSKRLQKDLTFEKLERDLRYIISFAVGRLIVAL